MVFELEISLINFASNLMFLILPPLNSNSGSTTVSNPPVSYRKKYRPYQKAEYLVKTVKKYFLKKLSVWLNTYKSGNLRDKLPKRTMYIKEHLQQVRQIFVLFGQSTMTFIFCLPTFFNFYFIIKFILF